MTTTNSHRKLSTAQSPRFLAPFAAVFLISCAVGLSACSSSNPKSVAKRDPFAGKGSPIYPGTGPLPKGGGRYHVGKPYDIAGEKFVPRADPDYDETGVASWYGKQFNRRMTSNGEWFDMDYLSAAHTTMPLPSYAKVTNVATGRSLIVRVNDRGPFVNNRVIDLSRRSAEVLEVKTKGTAKVRVQYIGPAPLNDKGQHLMAMNDELKRGTPMQYMVASADARAGRGGGSSAPAPVMVASAEPRARPVLSTGPAPVTAQAASPMTASVAPAARTNGSGYYIQAAALSNVDNAERARNTLSGLGPVEVSTLDNGASKLFRVRVGPIGDPNSADSTLRNVIAAGYADARIIPASY